ncbi:Aste57867_134 [Aphanomyces stellatus]|uniref:Aste57867_134 protein n=1 Tax=Aphanomyces stellatus TaxID=120398 RepID=A0A485K4V4_9STRA|nr:hypothetical protein As57867_000134 [Aphanomyces stellatus]VFT77360.1 Aste57867_134 [Aphanomyces stellatus]
MFVCKYAYKQCSNPRVMKKDGDLHRLCEYHRDKANALQRTYATKRRHERRIKKRQLFVAQKLREIDPVPFGAKVNIDADTIQVDDLDCLFDHGDDYEGSDDSLSDDEFAYVMSLVV